MENETLPDLTNGQLDRSQNSSNKMENAKCLSPFTTSITCISSIGSCSQYFFQELGVPSWILASELKQQHESMHLKSSLTQKKFKCLALILSTNCIWVHQVPLIHSMEHEAHSSCETKDQQRILSHKFLSAN